MQGREAWDLRRAIAMHESGRGVRYTKELKARVVAYATERRRYGATWSTIATELGMTFETVRRWCSHAPTQARALALRRVEVVPQEPQAPLAVVSPSGYRIEGVTLESAAQLLRALG